MSRDDIDRSRFPTGVFWSLEDCPIPEGLNPSSIYENMKKGLEKKGYDGALSIKAYGDGDKEQFTDAQIELVQGDKTRMTRELVLWAMDNYKGSNLIIVANDSDAELLLILHWLKTRGCLVILAQPGQEVASESLLRNLCSVWLSTSLLEEGNPVDLSGICIANFDDFNSPQDLEALGTVRLKIELQSRGMKCGGTLQARAARLFLLKSTPLDKLPKKFLAKKKKEMSGDKVVSEPLETMPEDDIGDDIAGNTAVFWDYDDLAIAGAFNPFELRRNLTAALATKKNMIGFLRLYFYVEKQPIPDYLAQHYINALLHFRLDGPELGGKYARVQTMVTDTLLWAFDARCAEEGKPKNLMVVSNTISQEPEMISFLQALKKRNISVLLVRSDKMENFKEVDVGDISTENFDWLWESLIYGGKSGGKGIGTTFCSGCGAHVASAETQEEAEAEEEEEEEEAVAQQTEE